MRLAASFLILLCSFIGISTADTGISWTVFTFSSYLKKLSKSTDLVFSSSCLMLNGDRGEMLFQQSVKGGRYFEIRGDKIIRSEELVNEGGGYLIKVGLVTRFIGKGDEPIKTLIMSPYFVLTPYELDSILLTQPKDNCFEQRQ